MSCIYTDCCTNKQHIINLYLGAMSRAKMRMDGSATNWITFMHSRLLMSRVLKNAKYWTWYLHFWCCRLGKKWVTDGRTDKRPKWRSDTFSSLLIWIWKPSNDTQRIISSYHYLFSVSVILSSHHAPSKALLDSSVTGWWTFYLMYLWSSSLLQPLPIGQCLMQ